VLDEFDPENYAALRRAESQGRFKIQNLGPGLEYDFLWFNLNPGRSASGKPYVDPEKRALFEKAEFRRAVSHALNRRAMARSILRGLGTPEYGPVPVGNKAWYRASSAQTEYDPAKARRMLEALGLKDTDGDGVLELQPKRPLEVTLLTARGFAR